MQCVKLLKFAPINTKKDSHTYISKQVQTIAKKIQNSKFLLDYNLYGRRQPQLCTSLDSGVYPWDNVIKPARLVSAINTGYLQALFAEAELLSGSGTGTPKMVELIDTIMSIPSCLQVGALIIDTRDGDRP